MSQPKATGVKKKPIVIVISYDEETNQVRCEGPVDNGQLFLGLLEMAKVVFMENRTQALVQRLTQPRPDEAKIIIPGYNKHN